MGLRFSKRIRIAPGLRVNLSLRRGISASIGTNGASHNVGLDGRQRSTLGAPGTGLSYVHHHRRNETPRGNSSALVVVAYLVVAGFLLYLWLLR